MMMTPLYYIGFLLLLANGIPTSEGNELEKTVNGIQGEEGMMMAVIAKTGKEERRKDSMEAEDASSEKSVETSDEDEELSEEDGGKSDEDQEEEKEELSEEDRGKSEEDQDSSEEVTREDLVPCSGPITNPALVGPSRDNCANPM